MTEKEKIDAVARAMAATRYNVTPNDTDRDFATRFVAAWQCMKAIDAAELAVKVAGSAQARTAPTEAKSP